MSGVSNWYGIWVEDKSFFSVPSLQGKENVMMIWQGVGKQEIAKKVLHPYLMPITDLTHLLEVSVFLFGVFENMSSY